MSKSILAHYSPEDVNVIIAGLIDLEGFTEGSFVSIRRDKPLFISRESADGQVSRTRVGGNTYTVELDLMSTSESNEMLTRLSLIDHSTHVVKFPLYIKDSLGSTLLFSTTAWIEQHPDTAFSTTVTSRKWMIKCSQATLHIGGNENPSSRMEDLTNGILGLAPSFRSIF